MCLVGRGGRTLRRVVQELRRWFSTRLEQLPVEPPEWACDAERAEEFKLLIYEFCDSQRGGDISVPVPKVPFRAWARDAFWDQIALSRLRFQGGKRTYLVCRSSGGCRRGRFDRPAGPRALVLHPPERRTGMGMGGDEEGGYDAIHASRQASYRDNADGIFEPGLRVRLDALAAAGVDESELRRVRRGYEMALKYWPAQYHGRHYGGALDHPDKLQAEHQRMVDRHYVEGPLHYVPWVVQSLGGVWKADKDKWRTIVDATSSGVNPACVPLTCRYDTLAEAVGGMTPGCKLSAFDAFDLTDAFLNWPDSQMHSDLMGYADTKGEYYRYRYLGFGAAQSPAIQQHWAGILKEILNREGLRYCSGAAADYSTFKVVLAYVDDFMMAHTGAAAADPALARAQFDSCMRVLADLGLEEKVSKRSLPSTRLEVLGFVVDSVAQTVTVSADRCAKLIAEIDAFLEEGKQQTDVGRRDLAGLIGRLQWVAQVTDGGQLHLRRAYRARDAFVGDVGDTARARWGRGVRVERTTGLCLDLEWWRHELGQLAGRRLYLTNLAVVNGFWRGEIAEGDEQLDAAGGAAGEDVVVATTDASGYAGGAWTGLERAAWRFEDAIRAPNLSSNYRELLTAVLTLERWGASGRADAC